MDWIDRSAVLEILGVKTQSLYAYVSRGLVRAKPHPDDPRASLYSASDVARLAHRRRSSRARAAIAQDAIAWGEPVMETHLTGVDGGRLIYAGADATVLSAYASLEEIARRLWGDADGLADGPRSKPPVGPSEKARLLAYLATEAAEVPSAALAHEEAWRLLQGFVDAACGTRGRGLIHDRLAAHWRVPGAADAIRRALVLVADHELNPSTFAARVAAGTGAGLAACALAGLATLTGPRHGEAAAAAVVYLRAAGASSPDQALAAWLASGAFGVGHSLYAGHDPRAAALLAALSLPEFVQQAVKAAEEATGKQANIDMALSALTVSAGLPDSAPFVLFAVGRMVGWLAHAFEQHRSGAAIRPRARYVGSVPS